MEIREAISDDLPRLLEIYNHYVVHTHVTFDTVPLDMESRRVWFEAFSHEGPHRLFVVESSDGVAGYASSREFHSRPAYARSVEASVYVAPGATGLGLGLPLYARLLDALEEEPGVHRVYGGVALPNEASFALHQTLGFKRVATFSEVGFKFGRYWDVAWFERAV